MSRDRIWRRKCALFSCNEEVPWDRLKKGAFFHADQCRQLDRRAMDRELRAIHAEKMAERGTARVQPLPNEVR